MIAHSKVIALAVGTAVLSGVYAMYPSIFPENCPQSQFSDLSLPPLIEGDPSSFPVRFNLDRVRTLLNHLDSNDLHWSAKTTVIDPLED